MSDVGQAVEQDAIAESLLGDPAETETPAAETGTEQAAEVQAEEPNVEQTAEPTEEIAEDWLPTEQDKVFPDDVYAKYAERYQLTPEQAADPLLRQLLHDKINSDIFLRSQQQQEQDIDQPAEQEFQEPTPEAPQLSREQYFANLDRVIQERTDPEVAKAFHSDFLRAFGVPEADIAKMPATQAMQFTQTASKYMLNLVNTFMGDILQAQIQPALSQIFPGFGEMYERSAYAMAWDRVRNSNPQYQSLPAYGSKEFSQKLRETASRIPGFDEMQFTDQRGNPLGMMDNAMRKYSMLAQAASGGAVDTQLLQRAAAAGAQNARRADVRRSAGNLGSGKSKSAAGPQSQSKFQSNTDLFDDDTMELYRREHGRL